MKNTRIENILLFVAILIVSGCASIPQESVTLNKEIAGGITSIHKSNIKFVNQYFENKKITIDDYEKTELDNFFNKIAAATTKTDAPPFGVQNLYAIKEEIEKIHRVRREI